MGMQLKKMKTGGSWPHREAEDVESETKVMSTYTEAKEVCVLPLFSLFKTFTQPR